MSKRSEEVTTKIEWPPLEAKADKDAGCQVTAKNQNILTMFTTDVKGSNGKQTTTISSKINGNGAKYNFGFRYVLEPNPDVKGNVLDFSSVNVKNDVKVYKKTSEFVASPYESEDLVDVTDQYKMVKNINGQIVIQSDPKDKPLTDRLYIEIDVTTKDTAGKPFAAESILRLRKADGTYNCPAYYGVGRNQQGGGAAGDGETIPTEPPTEEIEPTKPTEPTDPTDPENPDPVDPTNPENPDPVDPVDPEKPTPEVPKTGDAGVMLTSSVTALSAAAYVFTKKRKEN